MLFLSSSLIIEYTPFLFLEYPWLCIFHIIYVFTVCESLYEWDRVGSCHPIIFSDAERNIILVRWILISYSTESEYQKLTSSFCQILWWNIIVSIKYSLCENILTIQPCLPFQDGTDLCIVDDSQIEGILCIFTWEKFLHRLEFFFPWNLYNILDLIGKTSFNGEI